MIASEKLDFWVNNNMNVLLKAKHGVGKTHIITDTFKRHNLKYLYFSGSTMDPWVDFVGVPKEFTDANGVTYLDLVRPKPFAYDDVEAIFIDELNRSPSKVRNAIMELLQFKSINGKKFNNLRMIWAAVNPPDSDDGTTYQTEEFDPAQEDRFHVIYSLPYKPDHSYFASKYGPEKAKVAINWWNALSTEQKNSVSPRRLDLALQYVQLKGDVRDVLPKTVNVSNLITQLLNGSYKSKFDEHLLNVQKGGDHTELQAFLSNSNIINELKNEFKNPDTMKTVAKALPPEMLFKFLSETKTFDQYVSSTSFEDNAAMHVRIYNTATISKKNRQAIYENMKNMKKSAINSITNQGIAMAITTFSQLCNDAYTTAYRIKAINYILNTTDFNESLDDDSAKIIADMLVPLLVSTQEGTFKSINITKNVGALRMKELHPHVLRALNSGYSTQIKTRVASYFNKYI